MNRAPLPDPELVADKLNIVVAAASVGPVVLIARSRFAVVTNLPLACNVTLAPLPVPPVSDLSVNQAELVAVIERDCKQPAIARKEFPDALKFARNYFMPLNSDYFIKRVKNILS